MRYYYQDSFLTFSSFENNSWGDFIHHSRDYITQHVVSGKTLCGFGPISRLFVLSLIQVAKETKDPIQIVCSRNQVECEYLGGGYANHWTTEEFAQYIKENATQNLLLCRDHGGPWQSSKDSKQDFEQAMKNALKSFHSDIRSGFQFLHIDPCLFPNKPFNLRACIERTKLLIEKCLEYALQEEREISVEVGAEGHAVDVGEKK